MSFFSILIIAFALSLDAFAVSITCGIKLKTLRIKKFLKISGFFGIFQMVMPLLGWFIGDFVKAWVEQYDHWIAFIVFLVLGIKTIKESLEKEEAEKCAYCDCANLSCLSSLALATSIDAFIIGIVFALFKVPLVSSVLLIGLITFGVSLFGCLIGNKASDVFGKRAGLIAGVILIALAVKILI